MMKIKRIALLIVALSLLTAALSGCGAQSKKSLADHGMDVVALMAEMVESDDFYEVYNTPDALRSIVDTVANGDYDEPENVYAVTIKPEKVMKSLGIPDDVLDDLSDDVQESLYKKAYSALITSFNNAMGSDYIACAAIYTAGKTFVYDELEESVIYFYTFDDSVPIAIAFVMGEDGSVSANGWFMFGDKLDFDSAKEFEDSLKELCRGCYVEKIK